jgi:uncharacterized membrane protein
VTIDESPERTPMRRAVTYFLRGAVITFPLVLTVWVAWAAVRWIDSLLRIPIPGIGLLVVLLAITLIGALGTNVVTRAVVGTLDEVMTRVPVVRLVYNATKDLMHAFAGEKKQFNRAVRVQPDPSSTIYLLGFATNDDLTRLGLDGMIAVYLPQAYNIGGNLVLVPVAQVTPVEMDGADLMAFIVSGGVARGA